MSPTPSADDAAHGTLLSESLQRLQLKEQTPSSLVEPTMRLSGPSDAENSGNDEHAEHIPTSSDKPLPSPSAFPTHIHEGYGFRPVSGTATPEITAPAPAPRSPLPDPNGLGWPGKTRSS